MGRRHGSASGARGSPGLVGGVRRAPGECAARGGPGSRLLDMVGGLAVTADLRGLGAAPASEIAVTHDVQLTGGGPQPIPEEILLDGFDDCQFTLCATTVAWPHDPAIVDYHATEGHSWRLRLSHDGAQVAHLAPAAAEDPDTADASARGAASDLVLFFYGRIRLDSLKFEGDRRSSISSERGTRPRDNRRMRSRAPEGRGRTGP